MRIKKSDCAGSSLALHSLDIYGHMHSLNSVVVKKLGFSIIAKILGRTLTDKAGNFIESNSKGITFLTNDFLSNFSRILVIPFKNYTLLECSLESIFSRYFIVLSKGS